MERCPLARGKRCRKRVHEIARRRLRNGPRAKRPPAFDGASQDSLLRRNVTAKHIQVGNRAVGDGAPCFIVAEVGSNHNQDFDMARRLIDAAAKAGADAVKFQTFRAAEHYSRKTPGFSYLESQDTFSLIKSLELNRDWHAPLKQHAETCGIEFFSSPCDAEAIAELERLGAPAYKVASFDLPDTGLINRMATTGKPVILSTGMADMDDVRRGVEACKAAKNDQIVLLQCTSLYPAPAELTNLRAMETLRDAFDCLVGYSDHTRGDHITIAAVTRGACLVEKHFTLDRNQPGPDHPFAIHPDELADMVHRVREVEAAIGDGIKAGPRDEEREMYEKGRRSLHASRDIAAGESIAKDMLTVKRPGYGIPPHEAEKVIGCVAKVDIKADQWITWDMV
ncbi:MAG: N-acetylneuraminate synthase family protein [Alphaproteobacteria bacterium]|nr:N-acetylneuraminate synthase family protein [Alphaproteobacteria bacterium]